MLIQSVLRQDKRQRRRREKKGRGDVIIDD